VVASAVWTALSASGAPAVHEHGERFPPLA